MNNFKKFLATRIDFSADFRIAANLGCACTAIILLTPFAINNFYQGRLLLGFTASSIIAFALFNAVSIVQGRFYPQLVFALLTPIVVFDLSLIIWKQGMIGVLWCYPAILFFYFTLPERQAWFANFALLTPAIPLAWITLENLVAIRAAVTLLLASIFSVIFVRLISYQQEKLFEAKERAVAANTAKSEFLASMSHELRTPLNAVLGFSELMLRDHSLTQEQRSNLSAIGRSGEYLLSLINDVLEFSKIEAGRVIIHEENFNLHHLLLELKEMFLLRARQKGLSLVFYHDNNVPQYIQTDKNKLRQILVNLLGNAIKFTHAGDVNLRVASRCSCDGTAQIQLLQIEVIDSGIGIPLEEQEKVFSPFIQADGKQTRQQGTGLGLTISRRFSQMLGGNLQMTSKLGQGTTFLLDIPVVLGQEPSRESSLTGLRPIALQSGQPDIRILVAEDNTLNRQLLVKLLRKVGHTVQEAVNGQEAIEKWRQWQPDLIWMDIRMPVMDGYEAMQKIKASPGVADTVIIALTANAFEEDRNKVLENGGDDFVRKPFKEREIFQKMEEHLGLTYIYTADTGEPGGQEALSTDEVRQAIAKLPLSLNKDIQSAVERIDYDNVASLLQHIHRQDEALADALFAQLNQYQFDKLQKLFSPGVS